MNTTHLTTISINELPDGRNGITHEVGTTEPFAGQHSDIHPLTPVMGDAQDLFDSQTTKPYRRLDPLRLSHALHIRMTLGLSSSRQRLEQSQPDAPKTRLRRSLGIATSLTGIGIVYAATRAILASRNLLQPPTGHYAAETIAVLDEATRPTMSVTLISHELTIDPDIETDLPSDQDSSNTAPPAYDLLRTAFSTDTSTGQPVPRASNLTDWARSDIAEFGQRAGLSADHIANLQNDPEILHAIITGYQQDNPVIGPDGMLNEGDAYRTNTARRIADTAVQQLADSLRPPEPPEPPEVEVYPPPTLPPPPQITDASPTSTNEAWIQPWHYYAIGGAGFLALTGMVAGITHAMRKSRAVRQFEAERKGTAHTHSHALRKRTDKYAQQKKKKTGATDTEESTPFLAPVPAQTAPAPQKATPAAPEQARPVTPAKATTRTKSPVRPVVTPSPSGTTGPITRRIASKGQEQPPHNKYKPTIRPDIP